MDGEDSVVLEIDVVLAKDLGDSLFLLQYPSRSARRPFDSNNVIEAKLKPEKKKVELTMSLDTNKPSYDSDRGNQFAVNAKGAIGKFFNSEFMDRQVFQTTQTVNSNGRYFVGYLKDGRLNLSPLSALLHMHSTLSYMDTDEKSLMDESALAKEEATPVLVKFAKPESDRARKAREKSFSYHLQKLDEEPWMPVPFYPLYSEYSSKRLSQLVGVSDDSISKSNSSSAYVETLLNQLTISERSGDASSDSAHCKQLTEQLQTLLLNVKWATFVDLLKYPQNNVDPLATLRSLQNVAVLVQENWIVKSEILYPKNSVSKQTGISSDILCRARDFILWNFTQSLCIARSYILSAIKIPDADLKAMLEDIAYYVPNKGWVLAEKVGEAFKKIDTKVTSSSHYTDAVQRQKLLWNSKYLNLAKILRLKTKPNELGSFYQSAVKKRERLSSESESECFNICRATSSEVIKMEIDSDNSVIASSTFETELSKFVSDCIAFSKVTTVSELQRHLNLKRSQNAPGYILSSRVTDSLLEQALREVGALWVSQTWPEVIADERIYAAVKFGDGSDNLRRAFLELFRENPKQRKPAIKKGIEKAMKVPLTDDDFSLLQKDYCMAPKRGNYFIKYCNATKLM